MAEGGEHATKVGQHHAEVLGLARKFFSVTLDPLDNDPGLFGLSPCLEESSGIRSALAGLSSPDRNIARVAGNVADLLVSADADALDGHVGSFRDVPVLRFTVGDASAAGMGRLPHFRAYQKRSRD